MAALSLSGDWRVSNVVSGVDGDSVACISLDIRLPERSASSELLASVKHSGDIELPSVAGFMHLNMR